MLDAPQFAPPALKPGEMGEQEDAHIARGEPHVFNLKGQLLAQGRTDAVLAATDDLTIRLKIYASGGENELHAHPTEDHAFMILQGSARFYGPSDETIELGKYEGIMLPKGKFYKFFATSEEPLVMIRVGNPSHAKMKKMGDIGRINIKGEEMVGHSKENKHVEVVFKDEYFGD